MITALGTGIAQTDEEFVGRHGLRRPDIEGIAKFATFRQGLTGC